MSDCENENNDIAIFDEEPNDEELDDDLAYKVLSGSESKVERELNILAHEGLTIDEMSAFDSNNGTVLKQSFIPASFCKTNTVKISDTFDVIEIT